jgi:hypothetical protein
LYQTRLAPPVYTTNQELSLALGATTIVYMTSTINLTFFGIAAVGGNVDGMVVTLTNITLGSIQHSYAHESGSASTINRLWNPGLNTVASGVGIGSITYRFDGTISRWTMISKTV